ncbi:MAG: tRNA epoxyqueuosine(34) reductase QueG [Planctomycetota bacterium]
MREVAKQILERAAGQGFALAGFASAEPSRHAEAVRRWVAEGKHGTMQWIENHLDVRLDLDKLLPGAKNVIAVCDAYAANAESSSSETPTSPEPRGKVARYAWGDDYHKVLKKRLHRLADTLAEDHPEASFRTAVDTAPALERELAARAGLGWQGKNTMLIHPRHGSYTLLGLIVTTLELPTSEQLHEEQIEPPNSAWDLPATDHCANCTRCIEACPTDAIAAEGYAIDATRCVSYLTIEHRDVVAEEFHAGFGSWVAGCDICQEVCPYNTIGERHPLPIHERYDPGPRKLDIGLDLLDVLSWTADDRARVFRGSALKRIKLDMIRRNALIALGNALAEEDRPAWRDAVERCLEDDSALVAATARQVWDRLADASA